MRRVVVAVGLVCLVYAVWHLTMSRSTTIRLEPVGYEVTYSMAWGLGMEEKLTLTKFGEFWSSHSSDWIEIWKKPYNSGVAIYVSDDEQTYYFGTGYGLHLFWPQQSRFLTTCDKGNIPPLTPVAERLVSSGSEAATKDFDAGDPRLFEYVQADQSSGPIPGTPPNSKYYVGLKYLGQLGLLAGDGRGSEVRFVPAGTSIEPRLGLHFHCG
jgi:hypothetical protein